MAIEIGQNAERRGADKLTLPLFFSIVLLMTFLGAYAYITISLNKTNEEIEKKEAEIAEISYQRKDIEQIVSPYGEKVDNFKEIFQKRRDVVNVFPVVESLTHPYVWFSGFSFDTENNVSLSGKARDFTSLGQQIIILRNIPNLKEITISGIQPEEEEVSFSLSFSVDSNILR